MDSGALLDLLGNENRRRILRLLAQKPCYVTEISEHLDVSPKAVIDHLRRLEEAGLVRSRTDENRRKYFYIANDLRLEVSVSRYGFGAKSAYPASSTLDLTTCRHLDVQLEATETDGSSPDIVELAADLKRLEELENELSLAQRYVQGQLIDIIDRVTDSVSTEGDLLNGRLVFEILVAIATGHDTARAIADEVGVPRPILEDSLEHLRSNGILEVAGERWEIAAASGN